MAPVTDTSIWGRGDGIRSAVGQPIWYLETNPRIFTRKSPTRSAAVSRKTLKMPEDAKREPDRSKPRAKREPDRAKPHAKREPDRAKPHAKREPDRAKPHAKREPDRA